MFRLLIGSLLALAVFASGATAEMVFTTTIDGPAAGTGSSGTGSATLTLNDEETEVAYVAAIGNLQGFETGAHFHGVDDIRHHNLDLGPNKSGTWDITPAQVIELKAGNVYINVHSDVFIMGEIRGDFDLGSVASEFQEWGAIKALYR
ncbi:MAG: hypothetical protein ACI9UK_001225 [Candidatus Krumholzibacteriia bacterium]|jgi:hypothetical protein